MVSEAAARIEFLAVAETALREGKILSMSELQSTFEPHAVQKALEILRLSDRVSQTKENE